MDFIGYCVRVDALDGYLDKMPTLQLHKDFESIIGVKHVGTTKENPHYHLVIKTSCLQQAFRFRLRKIFDAGKGNGHMSIKPWDGKQEAISYLFHEDPNALLVIQYNVSDETVASAKALNQQIQRDVEVSKEKASYRAEDVVYQILVKKQESCCARDPFRISDRDIGTMLILHCMRSGKYAPQPWLVRAMATRIQFRLLNGSVDDEQAFAEEVSRNIFYDK